MDYKGRHLGILVKPASSKCNMCCGYCFYADLARSRAVKDYGIFDEELTELFARRLFEEEPASVSIALQGGEPLLWGAGRCRTLLKYIEKYNTRKLPIYYSIQTNGLALTDEWVEIFKKHRFLVGISLDGTRSVHDLWRKDTQGGGTFARVLKNVKRLKAEGIDCNILSVVTKASVPVVEKIFRFYMSAGADHLQFLPCMDLPEGMTDSASADISADEYGEFLIRLYRLWEEELKKGNYISIRRFDNYIYLLKGQEPESCAMSGSCGINLVMEADGSVFPCDFYVTDRWLLGNIRDAGFGRLSEAGRPFREETRSPRECFHCPYAGLCRGGCKRDMERLPDGTARNKYCASYRRFFDETLESMKSIAGTFYKEDRSI